jgi:hypothetical protein
MSRILSYVILPALLLAGIYLLAAAPGSSALAGEASLPAPLPAGPKPTIILGVSHGLPGAAVAVSGNGVAPYPAVRLAWLDA